jgi:hypothetical protein
MSQATISADITNSKTGASGRVAASGWSRYAALAAAALAGAVIAVAGNAALGAYQAATAADQAASANAALVEFLASERNEAPASIGSNDRSVVRHLADERADSATTSVSLAGVPAFLRMERQENLLATASDRSVVQHLADERADSATTAISLDGVPAFLRSERDEVPGLGR